MYNNFEDEVTEPGAYHQARRTHNVGSAPKDICAFFQRGPVEAPSRFLQTYQYLCSQNAGQWKCKGAVLLVLMRH